MIATTGFFDGVHMGHRVVLQRVAEVARAQEDESAAITFWPHPRVILHQDSGKVRLLNTLDEKKQRIQEAGINHIFVLPFTAGFSQLSPEDFMKEYLCRRFQVTTLIVGYDHHLGAHAGAGYEQLRAIGAGINIRVERVEEKRDSVQRLTVSATKIREALAQGNVDTANRLLGYSYQLQGVVVEGQRIGRQLGFPTANMQLYEPLKQLPANGVYHTRVRLNDAVYCGMTNIGVRPTVQPGDTARTIETHILNFSDDIYGQNLSVEFLSRLRDERRFASLDDLKTQLQHDREQLQIMNYE
ncbi:MAG: bifunctional riboflavin kinase/FAD synthetase [Prevotellaceae bacterium]|jgi:riboflavin kinase/FMN adenylyltransferase|nr:bifunctional riboflavin kinase/FAD synthetase [Prevotellaceae bacterium]